MKYFLKQHRLSLLIAGIASLTLASTLRLIETPDDLSVMVASYLRLALFVVGGIGVTGYWIGTALTFDKKN